MNDFEQIKNENDVVFFHQSTCDCADGCIVGFEYITKTKVTDSGSVLFDNGIEQLKVYLESDIQIEILFRGVHSLYYNVKDDDEIIYSITLQLKDGLIYFSTDDCSSMDNMDVVGLSVTAEEMYWREIGRA